MARVFQTAAGVCFLMVLVSYSLGFSMGVRSDEPVFNGSPSSYDISWRDDIKITAHDGIVLRANVFVPKTSDPNAVFPVIVMASSWDCEEHEYYLQAAKFCEKGYIVLEYSPRGWGISGGLISVGGPNDMKDISTIITYLVANYPVEGVVKNSTGTVTDDSGAKVGMAGISYGGGFALLGAAHDQRVKAVMAMVPWGDLCSALYMNQTTKEVWHKMVLLQTAELIGNPSPEVREMTELLFAQDQPAYYDTIINWGLDRSPINYLDQLNYTDDGKPRDLAVCISSNLEDEMFPPNATLDFFYGLKTPKKRMDINRGIHASAEGAGILGMENIVWRKAHAWMDEHLKGINTGIMALEPMSICDKGNGQRYYADHIYLKDMNTSYLEGIYDSGDNVNNLTPAVDRKSTRLNSSHRLTSRMPSSA
jgi:pimeloyl-ACP methyl ester carboxylesterase